MWDAHTREVAESVCMEELAVVCDAAESYGAYKKRRGVGPGLVPYVPAPFLNPPPVHWW